jgi:hypothetical protein
VLEGEEEGVAHLLLRVLKDTGKWPAFVYVDRRTGFVSSSSVPPAAYERRVAFTVPPDLDEALVRSVYEGPTFMDDLAKVVARIRELAALEVENE